MEEKLVPYESVSRIAGNRVLVLAPHPDDEVFGCGGAIMRHVDAGDAVHVVIASNGEYRVDASTQSSYSKLRQTESQKAAIVLGCDRPTFWGIPDRALEYGEYLIERITDAINTMKADLVYVPSVFEMHPDHRALGMAALESVRRNAAKPQLAMYEIGIPMPRINTLLDISNIAERKQRAMQCFESQLREQAYDEHIAALNRFRTYTLGKQTSAAEGYFVASGDALSTDFLALYVSEYERQRGLGLAIASVDLPLVSILIRSMDRPLLREALDSVALQTYSNIEVVVINARVQAHRSLGDQCGRFPIRLINTVTPLLRSQAANVALANANGDYLIFLDDDDWLAPDHIANLVAAIRAHSMCDVAYAGVEFRAYDRQPLETEPFNEPFNVGRLRGGNYIPIHAVMFAHKLLGNGLHFDESFDVYEDWDFLLQLSELTRFVHVDRVSAYYRASGTSGVGVVADAEAKRHARAQIFDKWKAIWTGAELDDLVLGTTAAQLEKHNEQLDRVRSNAAEVQGHLNENILALAAKEDVIESLEKNLEELKSVNSELQGNLKHLREQEVALRESIRSSDALVHEVFASTSWYVTRPLRGLARRLRSLKQAVLKKPAVTRLIAQHSGVASHAFLVRNQNGQFELAPDHRGYTYIEPQRPNDIEKQLAGLNITTSFSIVVPVYNTSSSLLDAVIRSVQTQWYSNWTLILVDDASTSDETFAALKRIDSPQIQILRLAQNQGIAGATNVGLDAAQGDFIVFMDHDDELTPDCLFELAICIARDQPDFVYSDEDKLDETGAFTQPHFKPDWSPDTMMSTMFTGHVSCVRRSVLASVGGLRSEFNGCQDWDFVLRVSEHTTRISHVPKVLYHWRIIPASVASDIAAKPYVLDASRRVRMDALKRRGQHGTVEPVSQVPGYFRVNYQLQGSPRVSIIIPTRDGGAVLRCCIESILTKSSYRNFEIIVLDNGSVQKDTIDYLQTIGSADNINVIHHDQPFNFSELNNIGAGQAKGQLLLFLNDDTEVVSCDWLERMGGFAQLPHIGAVGAKLVYPKCSRIQHAGVINLTSGPAHAFINEDAQIPGYFMRNLLEYNWLAVTGACLMIETEKFHSIGGFDTRFPVAYNDIELCMRVVKQGLFNVVCQAVTLIHHESVSRGLDQVDPIKAMRLQSELRRLYDTHPTYFQFDPFHNPNLDSARHNFEVSM